MFRYHCHFPYSSAYLETDLRYIAAHSRSLTFNQDMFIANSHWLGVAVKEKSKENNKKSKRRIEILDSRYSTKFKNLKILWKNKFYVRFDQDFRIGSNLKDINHSSFYYKNDDLSCIFTIRAIFAGRDHNNLTQSLHESCCGVCLKCGSEIPLSEHNNTIEGSIFELEHLKRYEILCYNCSGRGGLYGQYRDLTWMNGKDIIDFVRYISNNATNLSTKFGK